MTHSDEENLFQLQLNKLFNASKSRLTNRRVVNALLTRNCQISAPYLSQLRTGTRQNPSDEVVGALADYFGVAPAYFFTTPQNDRNLTCSEDGQIVARLHHGALKDLLTVADGLSAESLQVLDDLATKLRSADQRRIVPADSPSYVRIAEIGGSTMSTRTARS